MVAVNVYIWLVWYEMGMLFTDIKLPDSGSGVIMPNSNIPIKSLVNYPTLSRPEPSK